VALRFDAAGRLPYNYAGRRQHQEGIGMAKPAAVRQARLEARVAPDHKRLIERAAALEGRSVTDFLVRSALRAAEATLEQHTTIGVTARDMDALLTALDNPPPPNERLRAAMARHAAEVEQRR
jgi:uncharacterized protein (DUF1778 family)